MQIDSSSQQLFRPYGYIYTITNKANNKQYVGQTTDIPEKRWYAYKMLLCEDQPKIYNALKKYGSDNFIYMVLDTAPDQIVLDYLEDFYIECLDAIKSGYNCKGVAPKVNILKKQKESSLKV